MAINDQDYRFGIQTGFAQPANLSVESSLLRIERMKLREALAEALNEWQRCLDEDHGEGVEVMGETDRIAELRKLLEGS